MNDLPAVVNEASAADMAAMAKVQEKCATVSEFKGLPGYREFHYEQDAQGIAVEKPGPDEHGRFEWAYAHKSNEQGKRTREFGHVLDVMTPFMKADTERFGAKQESVPRVALRDHEGGVRFVEPRLAETAAAMHGWGHVVRIRASKRFVRGRWYVRDGRDWRLQDGQE